MSFYTAAPSVSLIAFARQRQVHITVGFRIMRIMIYIYIDTNLLELFQIAGILSSERDTIIQESFRIFNKKAIFLV